MAKKEEVKFEIDEESINESLVEVPKMEDKPSVKTTRKSSVVTTDEPLVNCLRNEKIIIRHINKQTGLVTNPKHVLYGGMAENAKNRYVVPKLSSGNYVNVLTDNEKRYLEYIMGLEPNALSIYNKVNNFWDDSNDNGVNKVILRKLDNELDLSIPEQYIQYKILLANKNEICPDLRTLQDKPKVTYKYVITTKGEENKLARQNMSATMACYKEFGKIEDNIDTLRTVIEIVDGRPTSPNSKLEFLLTKANELIQANSRLFLSAITDPMLNTKVLIKRAIEGGLIQKRGDYLYLREDKSPLCELGQEPTLNVAANYLNAPKHQELKFALEAKLK